MKNWTQNYNMYILETAIFNNQDVYLNWNYFQYQHINVHILLFDTNSFQMPGKIKMHSDVTDDLQYRAFDFKENSLLLM